MTDFESVDFFTDESLVPDPYPYFDYLRSKCPATPASPFGVLAVTGYEEALAVYKDPAFSSCVSVAGPFSGCRSGRTVTMSQSSSSNTARRCRWPNTSLRRIHHCTPAPAAC